MKGLLIKDFCFMKQKHLLLVISLCSLAGFFSIVPLFPFFCTAFLVFIPSSTITTDKLENGWKALFVFPFTRIQYVLEKYLFVIGCTFPIMLIAALESMILWKLNIAYLWINLAFLLLFCALDIPILLFFSANIAPSLLSLGMILFIGGISSSVSFFLMELPNHSLLVIVFGSLIVFALSVLLSVKIMQKKDL